MPVRKLIQRYQQYRKGRFLALPDQYKKQYAFLGVGDHSIHNLYPVIQHLGLQLKWIYSNTLGNAEKMARRYQAKASAELNDILKDDEVTGVFVCLNSERHFETVKSLLAAGKNVFVEKAPCYTSKELEELNKLASSKNLICSVGLQRRYAPLYRRLKHKLGSGLSYNYRYLAGPYPKGNVVYELFIHPVDVLIYLFGNAKSVTIQKTMRGNDLAFQLMLEHDSGMKGTAELSTHYSWDMCGESLTVTTEEGIYSSRDTAELRFAASSTKLFGIPMEKVLSTPVQEKVLYRQSNFIPTMENNSVFSQGYFDEIREFAECVEGRKAELPSRIGNLAGTYSVLGKLV